MKKLTTYKIITIVIFILSLLCTALFCVSSNKTRENSKDNPEFLNMEWYYFNDSGEKMYVSLPSSIKKGKTFELFHDYNIDFDGKTIALYGANYDIEIYSGKTLIYQFDDNNREINRAVKGNMLCYATLPKSNLKDQLRLVYHSKDGKYNLPEIMLGTHEAITKKVFINSLFCLVVPFLMLVLGILAFIFGVILELQKERDQRIVCIGLFLISCGLWCLSDSAFVQFIFSYNQLIFSVDFYLFMIMPIPLSYFVLSSADMKKHASFRIIPILYFSNIIMQSCFAAFKVFTFFAMLYVTHILMMGAGVMYMLAVLVHDYHIKKKSEVLLCIRVLASVGTIGSLAILLYIFIGYSAYQIVYQSGVLLLMSVLLTALLKEFIQSVRYRTEAIVYKKLSEHDKLTNLENRRAFDSLLEKMENGSIKYEKAALVFMDVNFLKKGNDTYGHEFGDEILVGAGKCIKKAFGSFGYCYRIGGDEFCAVILNPSYTDRELIKLIHAETERFNSESLLPMELSVACGCSFINEKGNMKTLEMWKTEADRKMYEEKKRIKEQLAK